MGYEEKVEMDIITFGGLNSAASELFIGGNQSPDLQNIELNSVGGVAKRRGLEQRVDAAGDYVVPDGTGAILAVIPINNPASGSTGYPEDGYSSLFVHRGEECSRLRVASDLAYTNALCTLSSVSRHVSYAQAGYYDEANTDYWHNAVFCCCRGSEPFIIIRPNAASVAATTCTLDRSGTSVEVTSSAAEGTLIKFAPDPTSAYYTLLNGKTFHLTSQGASSGTQRNLLSVWYPTGSPVTQGSGGSEAGVPCYIQAYATAPVIRWPQGVYSATVGTRGYPARWDDLDGDAGSYFPRGDKTDFPSGIAIIGESLDARAYAFGFEKDPCRIDYSELGAPYNFLKHEVMYASEAAAPAQPGIDGGYFYANRGDGDKVIGVKEFFQYIAVFKRRKIMLYQGVPGSTSDPLHLVQTYPVGVLSEQSIVKAGNDIYFWSDNGPQKLSVVTEYGDMLTDSISWPVRDIALTISKNNGYKVVGRHSRNNGFVDWYFITTTGSRLALRYYYPNPERPNGEWVKMTGRYAKMNSVAVVENGPDGDEACFGGCSDPITVATGTEYMVFEMDTGDYDSLEYNADTATYDAEPIEAYYITRWYTPGSADFVKRALWVDLAIGELGYSDLSLYIGSDFNPNFSLIATQDIQTTAQNTWGTGTWNYPTSGGAAEPRPDFSYWTPADSYALVRGALNNLHKIVRFKLKDYGTGRFEVSGMIADFRLKGKRA